MKGIDVSVLQGSIDWNRVKCDGIDFAMIKATQGRGEGAATRTLRQFTDSRFAANINGAAAAGIKCGVYHYMTAKTVAEAEMEAEYFVNVISPYRDMISLWAAVDVESEMYLKGIPKPTLTRVVNAFMEVVTAAGYKPMLYTNPNFLTYRFDKGAFERTDIWLVHYGVPKPMKVSRMQIWQYGTGKVDGIRANVDLNEGYFELPESKSVIMPSFEIIQPPFTIGSKYTIKAGDKYSNGVAVPKRYVGKQYTIMQVRSDRILLGEIASWVCV